MSKIKGKYGLIYEYEKSKGVSSGDGIVYPVENEPGKKIKILNKSTCTKEKEMEIESAMNGSGEFYGPLPVDVLNSKGKFAGYAFYEEDTTETSQPDPVPRPDFPPFEPNVNPPISPEQGISQRKGLGVTQKIMAAALVGIVLSILDLMVFFNLYINLIYGILPIEIVEQCYTYNFNGIIAVIGGLIGIFLAFKQNASEPIIFILSLVALYLVGMAAVFFLITLIVSALHIFIALIPTLVVIAIMIYGIKWVLRSLKR